MLPTQKEIYDFVRHSNLIEELPENENHPFFVTHLEACELVLNAVREKRVAHPKEVHEVLMRPEPAAKPGRYRTCDALIEGIKQTPPHLIEVGMTDWWEKIRRGPCALGSMSTQQWIWAMHDEFEVIHPFTDGNGRTGRLVLNNLRLHYGLPWHTVHFEDRSRYFGRVRALQAALAEQRG